MPTQIVFRDLDIQIAQYGTLYTATVNSIDGKMTVFKMSVF